MTDFVTNVDGRPLSKRGLDTRRRLLDAAERVFGELGYHDASIVKITEAAGVGQGTFYLYFRTKKDVFDELVRDLNRRIRHAMVEQSQKGETRLEQELLGFRAFFRFTAEHPALYRVIRQAEFAAPEALEEHYRRFTGAYARNLRRAMDAGEIADADPVMLAWVLMAAAELVGMKSVVWSDAGDISEQDFQALRVILERALGA